MEPVKASDLYEALRSKAEVNCNNTSLSYYSCAIVVSVGLQLNPTLLSLSLSCNIMGDSGVAAIAEALKVNSILRILDLGYNEVGDSGAAAIAEALKVNSSLQKLGLYYNRIGDSGAAAIAEALKVNSTLNELSLPGNEIGNSGVVPIAEALTLNSSLQKLDLGFFGNASVAAIEESLERSLQHLNGKFPKVFIGNRSQKYDFLYALSNKGFRSFIMNDDPPSLWPHALAKVSTYPSLLFHLLLQIPGTRPGRLDTSRESWLLS
jgi:Ran GTPase-activating protein (RanGAP) involved in mRNA processing and transport